MNSQIIRNHLFTIVFFGIIPVSCYAVDNELNQFLAFNLCDKNHTIYFSCEMENEKIISLCGSSSNNKLKELYYRFGRKEKIELEFPSFNNRNNLFLFHYNEYHRAHTQYYHISFINAKHRYTIYSYYSGDNPEGDSYENGIYGSDPHGTTISKRDMG